MLDKKIFILLPDGIGLRNFAYTDFYEIGKSLGYEITFWNNTPFDLEQMGFKQIRITRATSHPLTEILKNARTRIELRQNIKKSNDYVYKSYRFPLSFRNVKTAFKSSMVNWFAFWNNSERGLKKIRKELAVKERTTSYYRDCLETLKREKPAMVFCTNQRIAQAIAPITAAQDLGIPTATFIFSWDNLPKGTKTIDTDFYFVWSDHMKSELLYYYPYIDESQIFITGTPQFESHFSPNLIKSREVFFQENNLDIDKKYICFSGDDITTSPNDPQYLTDLAEAITEMNSKGYNLGIVFRRCPVDFSKRFDAVLEKYNEIIKSIDPKWKNVGNRWSTILPTKEDLVLQMNTIFHTELVINLGSSMAFDYGAHGKPCGYINYDVPNAEFPDWSVKKVYNFIHFRSMPEKKAVFWLNNKEAIGITLETMLTDNKETVSHAQKWFEKINLHPAEFASKRIWDSISEILKSKPCSGNS